MIKRIYKYYIGLGEVSVQMPKDAKPLRMDQQEGHVYLWALVDTNEPPQTWRKFVCYPTGESLSPMAEYIYINTFFTGGEDHPFVWHAFELL